MICPSCLAGPGQGHDPDCNADRRPRERGVLVCKCDYAAMLKSDLATLQAETAKLITRNAQLEFDLGKAQGELEGLRAGWSVSNRDTAIRESAKLELLEEIRAEANERDRLNFHDFAFNLNYAFQAAEAKYRADGS